MFSANSFAQAPVAGFTSNVVTGCAPLIVQFQDTSKNSPTNWHWDLGNGTISSQQNPIGTYFNPGNYTVKLVVENASGKDSVTKVSYVTVNNSPTVNFSTSTTNGCYPLNVFFTDLSIANSGTITDWLWDFGDGSFSTQQNPQHLYVVSGSFTITLKVKNSNGCETILNKPNYISIASGVTSNFSVSSTTGCDIPSTVAFTNSSSGTGLLTYQWNFGDGGTSVQTNPSHTYTSAGSFTVSLIATNNSGCKDTVIKTNIITIGSVTAAFSSTGFCAGSPVIFTNNSTPAAVAANWYFGDGTTSAALNPVKTYSLPGTYLIKLVANFGACKDSITKSIVIQPKPSAAFNNSPTGSCNPPLNVQFNNTSSGANTYSWQFGDNATSTQNNPLHTYSQLGSFNTTLIATNSFGCSDTLTKVGAVKISPPVIISFTSGAPYTGCAPYTATYGALISSPETIALYEWNFNDGSPIVNGGNPVHTYLLPGSYTISLTVTTVTGCTSTLTLPNSIVLDVKPHASFTANPLNACASDNINFTDNSTGNITTWEWQFGDGGSSSQQNPIYNYTDTGFFNVMLIVSNNRCNDTLKINKYIYINPPIAKFSKLFSCDTPLQRRFIDESILPLTHFWEFGDGATSTLVNPVHIYPAAGIYPVKLTVTNGACTHTTHDTLNISASNASLAVNGNPFCKYANVAFTVNNIIPAQISNYSWNFGDGVTQTGTNLPSVIHQYSFSGTINPFLIITDVLGCNDTALLALPINIYGPKAGFSNPPGTCIKGTINFADTSSTDGIHAIKKWIWSYGDGLIDTLISNPFNHQYNIAGTFNVKLKIIDDFGCYDTLVKNSAVLITQPKANFHSADTIRCTNSNASFLNQSLGVNLSYVWNFGDNTTSTFINPQHPYALPGLYSVNLQVTDIFGCTDTLFRPLYIRVANSKASFNFLQGDSIGLCYPFLIKVANNSLNTQSVSWSFGDGGFSNLDTPSHFYNYVGVFPLRLRAFGYGGCVDSITKSITVRGPTGTFTYVPQKFCKPAIVQFKANTLNNATFFWDFSDGVTAATSDSVVTHQYIVPGLFRPKMILIDAAGCQVPITGADTIKVIGIEPHIKVPITKFCDSVRLNFFDSSIATNDVIKSYLWSFGDNLTSTAQSPQHFYTQPGSYKVSLKVTTAFGCSAIDTLNIPISIIQTPVIKITGDSVGCVNSLLSYKGIVIKSDTSAIHWNWDLANGSSSQLQNPLPQYYSTAATYTITAISSNAGGCADTVKKNIIIHPTPNTNAGIDSVVCRGKTITLQPSGALTYVWDADTTLSCLNCTSPLAKPDSLKLYKVTGFNSFGCSFRDSVYVNVIQKFKVTVSPTDTLCIGESTQLSASGADNYLWVPSTALSNPNINNPIANPAVTTNYLLVGSDNKNCFKDSGFVTIKVYPIPQFDIVQSLIKANVGSVVALTTNNSADITQWRWQPNQLLSCNNCPTPLATVRNNIKYVAEALNDGGCIAKDEVTIEPLCNGYNIYIPNTFTPNGDNMNDVFYPRGKGLFKIRSMKIFNRWGEIVFSKVDFAANDPSAGWDGTFKGKQLNLDVYVYTIEVICDNNAVIPLKGNISLLK